ncbi:IS30 family transposase, partial [Candidatus Terasakiella magnetica]|uniref:IS30 family transposase n=1 Tax=Candidatus Terasakiella magnetica TaxID=1867952 RepID=UPI0013F4C9B0
LAQEQGRTLISHESIYRFIYHRVAQADYWHRLLPQHKYRRGRLYRGGLSPVKTIKKRNPLGKRPCEANERRVSGHWEADLMLCARYKAVLVLQERVTRYTHAVRQMTKKAEDTLINMMTYFANLPHHMRRSVTFDN